MESRLGRLIGVVLEKLHGREKPEQKNKLNNSSIDRRPYRIKTQQEIELDLECARRAGVDINTLATYTIPSRFGGTQEDQTDHTSD